MYLAPFQFYRLGGLILRKYGRLGNGGCGLEVHEDGTA